jgi:hypothetical protein
MTLSIFRHARILVPASLDPRRLQDQELPKEKVSIKSLAKKSVGGIFALSGTTFVSATVLALASAPFELTGVLLGAAAAMVLTTGPVLSSHLNQTGTYIPFKKNHAQSEPETPVYFEPYRNWDEVFASYTDRIIDKHIECETPVGFVTVTTRDSADMYRIRQERIKGNSNISWSGIYGEISEYDKEIFFRTRNEPETVLFTESEQ